MQYVDITAMWAFRNETLENIGLRVIAPSKLLNNNFKEECLFIKGTEHENNSEFYLAIVL